MSALYHNVHEIEFVSDNRFMAMANEQVELWELRTEPEVHMVYVDTVRHNNTMLAVVVDENLQGLAVWSTDDYHTLAIGDIHTQQPLFELVQLGINS